MLLESQETQQLIRDVMKEVTNAAKLIPGVGDFPSHLDTIEEYITRTRGIGEYKPSMLIDFEHGRPLELQVILGNMIRKAKDVGFDMPLCSTIYALLKLKMDQNV